MPKLTVVKSSEYLFYVKLIHVVNQVNVYNLKQNYIRVIKYILHLWQTPCEWNQQMRWIPVLLVLLLYMFRAAFLPIIRIT